MGNSQTSKKQSCNVEAIELPKVQVQQEIPKQLNFAQEIEHQNVKNVNQRKSSNENVVENPHPKLSKKNLSNKELPPIKIRKSIGMPLGNSSSINKIENIAYDFEVVNCQKNETQEVKNIAKECEGNQENSKSNQPSNKQISSKSFKPKKFRPSHQIKRSPLGVYQQ